MLLTIFLAIVFCAAITLLLISAVAFVQYDGTNKWFFSSAPKEALKLLKPRKEELFCGAKTMGWVLMILSVMMILGVGVIAVWLLFTYCSYIIICDSIRSDGGLFRRSLQDVQTEP